MTRPRLRAFVLAAGYGTRLRPLTLFLPKALLPVGGEAVVEHTLRQLRDLGCETVVLNLHHLADAIPLHLGASYRDLPLVYSREEEIQGTLGALHPPRAVLRAADATILVNGDTLCRWPFRRMLRRHDKSGADATLLVHRRAPDPGLGGGVGLDARGRVVALRDKIVGEVKSRHVFAGAHVISKRLLDRVVAGPGDIVGDLYMPLLEEGIHVEGVITAGRWHDLGTPRRYLEANLDWLCRRRWRYFGLSRCRSWISPLASVHPSAAVVTSVVERGVEIGEDARVENSVLLAESCVAAGSRIERSILGPGVVLPTAARIEGRMINRGRTGYSIGAQETMMGELIYTPLDRV